MSKVKGVLSGGRVLTQWQLEESSKGNLIAKMIDAMNNGFSSLGGSAVGRTTPPPPVNGLKISVGGEYAHVAIEHQGEVRQGVNYFLEVANNEGFANAHPIDYGTSRTRDPIHLAPFDSEGNPQKWWMQAYSQYPGSSPSPKYVHPVPIQTTGTTRLSWSPSTGSGTAKANGSQPGWGFGKIQVRRK